MYVILKRTKAYPPIVCHDDNSDFEGPLIDDDRDVDDDILLLTENDNPGASLDSKDPLELNVTQLRRWLACRGAPLNEKKTELIKRLVYYNIICQLVVLLIPSNFRVCDYIKYGWDVFLIDPDGGANVQHKLQITATKRKNSVEAILLKSIPGQSDLQWTKQLYKVPKITFGSI